MTFFYDLNKKLDSIREKPEVTHGQLNERDMSRAAKGYEKYGKQGMEALAKAGREGKALDPVRAKYDKYDNTEVDEGAHSQDAMKLNPDFDKLGRKPDILGKIGSGLKKVADVIAPGDEELLDRLQKSSGAATRQPGAKEPRYMEAAKYRDPKYKDKLYTQEPPDYTYGPDMDDAYYNPKPDDYAGRKRKIGGGEFPSTDPLERGQGIGRSGIKNNILDRGPRKGLPSRDQITSLKGSIKDASGTHARPNLPEAGLPMVKGPDGKMIPKFAADGKGSNDLKKTFADKIAGAKKEVDEMLGDVAAEAMKSALSGGQKKLDKNNNGRLDANDFAMLRAGKNKQDTDEGFDDMIKDVERRRGEMKPGEKIQGHKGEIEKTASGLRHTRRYDAKTGETDVEDDGEKRGRGRPKGTKAAIGAKGPSGRSKLMNKEADHDEDPNVVKAKAILKKAGYTVSKDGEEDLEEKAVSKKQQRFMGMVHATQKGEKAPSKEVAKVAKSMGKKDADDFASTKHKGLPEKKKSMDKDDSKSEAPKKKKEKTEEAGGTGTPTASSGFGFGKGIYDSLDREVESMIAEGMNVNMSMNSDAHGGPSKSLTVTATDDDALKLGKLLKMAGLGDGSESNYSSADSQSACGEVDEAYGDTTATENAPDYPTNTETSDDALQYAGGLNKPKSTGQSTVPVLASQDERQESYAEAEEDALHRMMEMAGVKKKEVDEEKTDEGNKITGGLADDDIKIGEKIPGTDVIKKKDIDEGILASTANLWKQYKGQYGV